MAGGQVVAGESGVLKELPPRSASGHEDRPVVITESGGIRRSLYREPVADSAWLRGVPIVEIGARRSSRYGFNRPLRPGNSHLVTFAVSHGLADRHDVCIVAN
jgi:hypothetical protein